MLAHATIVNVFVRQRKSDRWARVSGARTLVHTECDTVAVRTLVLKSPLRHPDPVFNLRCSRLTAYSAPATGEEAVERGAGRVNLGPQHPPLRVRDPLFT